MISEGRPSSRKSEAGSASTSETSQLQRAREPTMTQVPQKPLVPGNSLITPSAEEGRALAIMLARNSIHAVQGDLETLKAGRAQYAHDPQGLIAASHVVAVE